MQQLSNNEASQKVFYFEAKLIHQVKLEMNTFEFSATASTWPGCRTSTRTWRASTARERFEDRPLRSNNAKYQNNVVQYVTRNKHCLYYDVIAVWIIGHQADIEQHSILAMFEPDKLYSSGKSFVKFKILLLDFMALVSSPVRYIDIEYR